MRGKKTVLLFFVAGLAAGALATFFVVGRMTRRQFAERYALDVIEQASLGTELRRNRQEDVVKRIDDSLPGYVRALRQNSWLGDSPEARRALRRVRDYYEMNSLPIPGEVAGILSELPPER